MNRSPKTQEVFGWRVATAIFLMATAAGSYIFGFVFGLFAPEFFTLSVVAIVLAAPVAIAGGLLLVCDMGQKKEWYHTFTRPGSSWMSLGAIFVTLFVLLDLVHIFAGIWPASVIIVGQGAYWTLGIITSLVAVVVLVYTGLLLGVIKSIPFWNGSYLAWLFIFSGLSTGSMATALVYSIYKFAGGGGVVRPLEILAYFTFCIIILQSVVLAVYLSAMKNRANTSVTMLTEGKLAGAFWGGVIVAAVILPLVFEGLMAFALLAPVVLLVLALIGGIIGLIGGFTLRSVVVRGGTRLPLNVQGVLVEPPPEKYRTKVIEKAEYETFQRP